jgi:hypothetical protein
MRLAVPGDQLGNSSTAIPLPRTTSVSSVFGMVRYSYGVVEVNQPPSRERVRDRDALEMNAEASDFIPLALAGIAES